MSTESDIAAENTVRAFVRELEKELTTATTSVEAKAIRRMGRFALTQLFGDRPKWAVGFAALFQEPAILETPDVAPESWAAVKGDKRREHAMQLVVNMSRITRELRRAEADVARLHDELVTPLNRKWDEAQQEFVLFMGYEI